MRPQAQSRGIRKLTEPAEGEAREFPRGRPRFEQGRMLRAPRERKRTVEQ